MQWSSPATLQESMLLTPESSSPNADDQLYKDLQNTPRSYHLPKLLTPESMPKSDGLYNMELRSQCSGIDLSLMKPEDSPHSYPEGSIGVLTPESMNEGPLILLILHQMELRSQCTHHSLMKHFATKMLSHPDDEVATSSR